MAMNGAWLLLGSVVALVLLGLLEAIGHGRNLARIPIRIHVNGTRGKSSVTRLIAAGLRQAGICTCAKTTGTDARLILPDGREYPIHRPAQPNVIEQVQMVRTAAKYRAQALVVECMALQPHLQWLSESKLIQATHAVITNARPDHLEVMGPTERDVALALAGVAPSGGMLFAADPIHQNIFQRAAVDRGSDFVAITPDDIPAVTPQELAGFTYMEHAENVALALKVCQAVGVDRAVALRGMWTAAPDPGVLSVHEINPDGRRIVFVNGFAANDPDSAERVWNLAHDQFPDVEKRIAVFNCRPDRPDRSRHLGHACARWRPADHYVLMGGGTRIFAQAAGLDRRKFIIAEDHRVEDVFKTIMKLAESSALVLGMGNTAGQGLNLVRLFHGVQTTVNENPGGMAASSRPCLRSLDQDMAAKTLPCHRNNA